ncbi:hypothetical protein GQR58_005707 [Nymphon striatum]|nr:hypothetical protein GQR58_005707 [Nymphon striatum]
MIFIVICCGYLYASYLKIKSAMELIELETDIDQIGAHLSDTVAHHTCNCPRANRHYCSRAERRLQLQASPDDLRTERCNQTYDHLPKSLQSGQLPLYDEVVQENSTDYSIPPPTYAECVGNSIEVFIAFDFDRCKTCNRVPFANQCPEIFALGLAPCGPRLPKLQS